MPRREEQIQVNVDLVLKHTGESSIAVGEPKMHKSSDWGVGRVCRA